MSLERGGGFNYGVNQLTNKSDHPIITIIQGTTQLREGREPRKGC